MTENIDEEQREKYYDERENPSHPEHNEYYEGIKRRQSAHGYTLNCDINDMFGYILYSIFCNIIC